MHKGTGKTKSASNLYVSDRSRFHSSIYQFPKRVIFADGNILFSAAGTFPEKAGRTEAGIRNLIYIQTRSINKIFQDLILNILQLKFLIPLIATKFFSHRQFFQDQSF